MVVFNQFYLNFIHPKKKNNPDTSELNNSLGAREKKQQLLLAFYFPFSLAVLMNCCKLF